MNERSRVSDEDTVPPAGSGSGGEGLKHRIPYQGIRLQFDVHRLKVLHVGDNVQQRQGCLIANLVVMGTGTERPSSVPDLRLRCRDLSCRQPPMRQEEKAWIPFEPIPFQLRFSSTCRRCGRASRAVAMHPKPPSPNPTHSKPRHRRLREPKPRMWQAISWMDPCRSRSRNIVRARRPHVTDRFLQGLSRCGVAGSY